VLSFLRIKKTPALGSAQNPWSETQSNVTGKWYWSRTKKQSWQLSIPLPLLVEISDAAKDVELQKLKMTDAMLCGIWSNFLGLLWCLVQTAHRQTLSSFLS
jgi:hypothetical protein